jgi:alpha-tubulin suppressor-like RCC1 family protein
VEAIDAGDNHTCARDTEGSAWCWGVNDDGQLGDGTTTHRYAPVRVTSATGPPLGDVVEIAAGGRHSCARTADSSLLCWGNNAYGQLGDGETRNRSVPVPVEGLTTPRSISLGLAHSCAVGRDDLAYCWGYNGNGRLGDRTPNVVLEPAEVSADIEADAIAVGGRHTCAVVSGTATCWGNNAFGQLGDTEQVDRAVTEPVHALAGVLDVAAGELDTCARLADDTLECWGDNQSGQLGAGSYDELFGPQPGPRRSGRTRDSRPSTKTGPATCSWPAA